MRARARGGRRGATYCRCEHTAFAAARARPAGPCAFHHAPLPPHTHTHRAQVVLDGARELICLAVQEHLVVAGSRTHMHILDLRQRCTNVSTVPVTDNGVRSLQLAGHLLSCGTGDASVVFFDLRYLRHVNGPRLRDLTPAVSAGGRARARPRRGPRSAERRRAGARRATPARPPRSPLRAAPAAPLVCRTTPFRRCAGCSRWSWATWRCPRQSATCRTSGARRALQSPRCFSRRLHRPCSHLGVMDAAARGAGGARPSAAGARQYETRRPLAARPPRRRALWPPSHPASPVNLVPAGTAAARNLVATRRGWVIRDTVYTHSWDPTGTQLFMAGGPLAVGLSGCSLSAWL